MPRNKGNPVPEGNDPSLDQNEFGPDQPTMVDIDRQLNRMKSHFDQQDEKLNESMEKTR